MSPDELPDQRPSRPRPPQTTSPGQASGPRKIGALVSQLMARRGYAQVFAAEGLQAALEGEVGQRIAAAVRVGNIKRGVLHIYVGDSVTLQELTFRKRNLLKTLQDSQPDRVITDLKFHISATANR